MKKIKALSVVIIFLLLYLIVFFYVHFNPNNEVDFTVRDFFYSIRTNNLTKINLFISNMCSLKSFILIGFLILIYEFVFDSRKIFFYLVLGIMAFSALLSALSKLPMMRERPILEMQLSKEFTSSFPSAHSLNSLCVYIYLAYLLCNDIKIKKTVKIICCVLLSILVLLIGISRMYLGMHYFTDVCGGFLLGVSILTLYILLVKILFKGELKYEKNNSFYDLSSIITNDCCM